MTWTAAILMLMASIGWVGEFITSRRRSDRYPDEYIDKYDQPNY